MRFAGCENHKGFTLVEIIAVLLLLGILSAVAVSHMTQSSADLVGETEVLKGHFRFAQMKAMNANVTWGFRFTATTCTLQTNGVDSATVFFPGETTATHTLPSGMSMTYTASPVAINEWGSPGATTITVTVSKGGDSRVITITRNTGFIP